MSKRKRKKQKNLNGRTFRVVFARSEGHPQRGEPPGHRAPRHRQDPKDGFKTVCGRDLLNPYFEVLDMPTNHGGRCPVCWEKLPRFTGGGAKEVFTRAQIDEMVRLYLDEKKSLSEIGEIMICQKSTVKRYLTKRAKITLRPKGGSKRRRTPEDDQIEEIESLYWWYRLSLKEVGEELGVDANTVLDRMVRHGVPRRPPNVNYRRRRKQAA